eukprot:917860-Amphidinium_carterae.1
MFCLEHPLQKLALHVKHCSKAKYRPLPHQLDQNQYHGPPKMRKYIKKTSWAGIGKGDPLTLRIMNASKLSIIAS